MLINTITPQNDSLLYTADTETGEVELFFAASEFTNIQFIEGGFIYDNKVYDSNLNELFGLRYENEDYDYIDYTVYGNTLYMEAENYETDETTVMIGRIVEDSFGTKFQTSTLCSYTGYDRPSVDPIDGGEDKCGDYYMITYSDEYRNEVNIYDAYGTLIMEVDTLDSVSESYSMGADYDYDDNYVSYDVSRYVTIRPLGYDTGTYLVEVEETWSLDEYDYYPDGEHEKDGTYYQYYILK